MTTSSFPKHFGLLWGAGARGAALALWAAGANLLFDFLLAAATTTLTRAGGATADILFDFVHNYLLWVFDDGMSSMYVLSTMQDRFARCLRWTAFLSA